MTIVLDVPIRRLAFRGFDDPALPTGIWWGTGVLVGDASGGSMQVRFSLKTEGQPVSGEMWNLEQAMAFIGSDQSRDAFITAAGLSPSRDLPGVDAIYRAVLSDMGPGQGQSGLANEFSQLPLFLGSVRGGADTSATIGLGLVNLTAAVALSCSMMGYIWGARSILAEGGPQRPPRGLFGKT